MEADVSGVSVHALVLNDTAVVDQQDLIRVQVPRGPVPLSLKAVGGAEVRDLQPADLSRT